MNPDPLKQASLTIPNRIDQLPAVTDFLENLGSSWNLPQKMVLSLNLVLEEALTNTILYGFDDQETHLIEINISRKNQYLSIRISDDGQAYDPTQRKDPDLNLPLEERPIGGLGIFLIKQMMDSVSYVRKNNKNYLTLKKNIGL